MILAVSDMHIGYEKFAHEMCWNNDKKGSFVSKLWDTIHEVSKEEANELKLKPSDRKEMENLYKICYFSS